MTIERYQHHGVEVAVDSALKGKHRQHCLCYVCDNFQVDGQTVCPIAKELYEFSRKHHTVNPVYECPSFVLTA